MNQPLVGLDAESLLQHIAERVPAGLRANAAAGLASVSDYLREAHAIARNSVLAPHGTTLEAFRRAYASLLELIEQL